MMAAPAPPPALAEQLPHVASLVVVAVAALALVLTGAFARRTRSFQRPLALAAVAAAAVLAWPLAMDVEYDAGLRVFDGMLVVDHLSAVLDLLVLLGLAGTIAISHGKEPGHGEREPLLLLGGLGAMLLAHVGDLTVLYVGAELLGVSVCALALTGQGRARDREGAWRAFVAMIVTSALMLMGIALLYAALSSTQLGGLAGRVATVFNQWGAVQQYVGALESGQDLPSGLVAQFHGKVVTGMAPASLFLPGMLLLLAGTLGKLGVVPFHLLRGDAIERAPVQVATFLLAAEPVAWVAVLLRVFVELMHVGRLVNEPYGWTGVLPTLALVTMFFAHLAALRERSLPRLVSWFWLAAAGNMLLGIVAAANFYGHRAMVGRSVAPLFETTWAQIAGDNAMAATLLALAGWIVPALGLMAALAATQSEDRRSDRLEEWTGLARRRPGLGLAITLCQLSLLGVPPLLGFVGKWSLLRVLIEHSSLRVLAIGLAVNFALATAVHLRVLGVVHARIPRAGHTPGWHPRSARVAWVMGLLALGGGVFAGDVMRVARNGAAGSSLAIGHPKRAQWIENERIRWARIDSDALEADAPAGAEPLVEPLGEADEAPDAGTGETGTVD
jgi:NADH-quinone oxidoreductase subunit N